MWAKCLAGEQVVPQTLSPQVQLTGHSCIWPVPTGVPNPANTLLGLQPLHLPPRAEFCLQGTPGLEVAPGLCDRQVLGGLQISVPIWTRSSGQGPTLGPTGRAPGNPAWSQDEAEGT